MPLIGAVRHPVSMTRLAHPSLCRVKFLPTRPSGSHHEGCGLGVLDEILGLAGRKQTIGAAVGSQILSGASNRAIGGLIGAPTGMLLGTKEYITSCLVTFGFDGVGHEFIHSHQDS